MRDLFGVPETLAKSIEDTLGGIRRAWKGVNQHRSDSGLEQLPPFPKMRVALEVRLYTAVDPLPDDQRHVWNNW